MAGVVPGEDLDRAGVGVDAADVVGPLGGDVDGAVVGHGDAAVGVHLGVDRGPAIPSAADLPAARKPRHDAGLVVYPPVGVVLDVVDVEVAVLVLGQVVGGAEACLARRAAVA